MPICHAPPARLGTPRAARSSRGASALPTISGLSTLQDLLSRPPRDAPVGGAYQRPFKVAYDHLQRQQELQWLEDTFLALDADGSGQVSYAEFLTCLNDPTTFSIMNRRFGVQRHETPRIFRALDADGSGEVSLQEWIETCKVLMMVAQEGDHIIDWRLHEIRKRMRIFTDKVIDPALAAGKAMSARHHPAATASAAAAPSEEDPSAAPSSAAWETPRKPATATPRRRRRHMALPGVKSVSSSGSSRLSGGARRPPLTSGGPSSPGVSPRRSVNVF